MMRIARLSWLLAIAVLSPGAMFAQLNVLMSGGFSAAYQELVPVFEKNTGVTVTTSRGPSQGNAPSAIPAQLRAGTKADVVILTREGLTELAGEGRIVAGSEASLATSRLGVGTRAGAPRPKFSTVEEFKQMLLQAKSINVVSTPGIYLTETIFPRLGVSAEVRGKLKGSGAVSDLANGTVEIGIRPVSELVNVPGVDYVGLIPQDVQFTSEFVAAVVAGSERAEIARKLIRFLQSDEASAAIRRSGMEPAGSKAKR